ncbi:MAG: hypothetical protein ABID84_04105 [Chloroflexota bacterium]
MEARRGDGPILPINYDNATKLLSFSKPHTNVGAVTYGTAVIGRRTAHSFIPEFEVTLKEKLEEEKKKEEALKVLDFSRRLSRFFMERWGEGMLPDYKGPDMVFIVGGYDPGAAYGSVFLFGIPSQPEPKPRNPDDFGMTWGGQLQIASRIVHGFDPGALEIIRRTVNLDQDQAEELRAALRQNLEFPIPYDVLPVQDCVDLATFLVRSTITAQSLAIGLRGVGGPIDVAVITRTEGLEYVQQKTIHGEAR